MAERDDSEKAKDGMPEAPASASGAPPLVPEHKRDDLSVLPAVESPPLSPAEAAESAAPIIEPPSAEDKPQTEEAVPAAMRKFPWLSLTRRQRRNGLRAATIAFALFAGAGYGMILGNSFAAREALKAEPDTAAIAERQATQERLAALSKQVASLKADLDRANKATQSKIAKISNRLESPPPAPAPAAPQAAAAAPQPSAPETTGSIPSPKIAAADVPLPRPAPQIAAPVSRHIVVPDWWVRDVIGGYVYVQHRGEIFEVTPGVPLPGLGRVRSVRREDGRWVVETPRGIIVALRDRRYFD